MVVEPLRFGLDFELKNFGVDLVAKRTFEFVEFDLILLEMG